MKHTDSYWTLFPVVVKEKILEYKDSQELIEWRESECNRASRVQIQNYAELRDKWGIGFIQCRPLRLDGKHTCTEGGCGFGETCEHMRIYGFYWDTRCVKRRCFLSFSLDRAIANCNYRKATFANICNDCRLGYALHAMVYTRVSFSRE